MPMTEVVEESLKADARFRHLTVMPAVWTKEALDRTEREGIALWRKIDEIVSKNFEKYWW